MCFSLHQKTIHEARRNLEEYKQTLKMRYAPVAMTAAQTPSPSEGTCAFPDFPRRTLSTADAEFQTSRETPAMNIKQSHNNIVQTDPAFLIQPPLPGPSSAMSTHPDTLVMDQPISHSVHEDGLDLIPHPAASTLLDETPSDDTSERHEVPLLPPAVFLEYMRSRRSQAPPTHLPPGSQQGAKDLCVLLQEKLEHSDPCRDAEAENNQQVRDRLRKQRDALHALLRAQLAKVTKIKANHV